ncbi:MAG: hypothetical protein ACTSR8_05375 [Promethearchaeota archaeon]
MYGLASEVWPDQILSFSHSFEGLSEAAIEAIEEKCRRIQSISGAGVQYKQAEILVPLVCYVYLKKR